MGARRLVVVWLVAGAIACGSGASSPGPGPGPGPDDTGGSGGGTGGGSAEGGRGGGLVQPDAAASPGSDAAIEPPVIPPDGGALSPDAGAPADAGALGAFPLEAVKAMKPEMYVAANAHLEGPSWRQGEIFFAADGAGWGLMRVDANRKLYRYHPKLAPVGSYLLADNSLLVCDHTLILVQVFEDGKVAQLATDFQGQAIEYCNDVTVDGAGNIYVSGRHTGIIYRISPAGEVVKVASGLTLPNGVEVDPDSKYLYFGVSGSIMRVALADAGGTFAKPERIGAAGNADGMAFDAWGNLWIADYSGKRLVILDHEGKPVTTVAPGGGPINLVFGGADNDTVFVLDDFKGLVKMGPVPGLRGFLHKGAPRYQVKKMLDLVPANQPVN
jgi:sugar lactone lactonase YvrE